MFYKKEYKNRFRILKGGLISLVVASNLYGSPKGGTVVSGTANISQDGNTTNINQSSNKAIINWQDFSIKSNETVNFNQPNINSITLNRVIGNEKSIIDGVLNANGQVWLINSNGVLFGKNSKVNTAGIVASTKNISNEDFNNGNYNFKGNSKASIENQGEINLNDKAYAVFVANSVINNGEIKVHRGTVHLTGADEFSLTLNENQNISLKVTKGALNSLVENNKLIIANGGNVYLTTNARDELLKGVVNNRGIIEASSLDDLQSEVILFANGGTANISGEIKAKDSFVETSGKDLNITNEAKITAKKWLLDPVNVTIDSSNGTIGNEKVGATVIQTALENNTDIEIQADNNINVNQAITWSTAQELTLNAGNNIYINKEIMAANNAGKLALKYGQSSTAGGNSDYYVNAKVNLKEGQNFSTQKGSDVTNKKNYTVITRLGSESSFTGKDLQGINGNLSGNYVLGADIDASATLTSIWNSAAGFNPLGNHSNAFIGTFDGLGHTISNLYIYRISTNYVGLFGYINGATIKNIGLLSVDISGSNGVGGLVGHNNGTIKNVYATGTVFGNGLLSVGGLVGNNIGTITNSYAIVNLEGNRYAGGLVGDNIGTITNSYARGIVNSTDTYKGGLVGNDFSSEITNSFYDIEENANGNMVDRLSYGKTRAEILTAFSGINGWIAGAESFEGYGLGVTAPVLPELKTFSTITPTGTLFEGGYGTITNPYTITNWTQLQNINNSNILTKNYYFNLLNNLNSLSSGYMGNSGEGWNPIGGSIGFTGTFDGKGFTISDLYINRPTQKDIGLFGYIGIATIKNIGLENLSISGKNYVGGLVGYNDGTILNSYASGTVVGNGDFSSVGGLVGFHDYGKIENSYASGTVSGGSDVGGLVGGKLSGTISNSFYDKTKFDGDGVGDGYGTGVIGLTTEEMSYGGIFKTAGWDIVADNTLAEGTPTLKYDSTNNKYVWAIAPKTFTANLGNQSTTYNGLLQNLSSIYTSQAIFGTTGVNLKFVDVDNNDITAYKNAGTYSNIGVVSLDEFIVAGVGTKGTLTINKANLDIVANSNSLVYNGQTQSVNGYSFGTNGLLGSDTKADLNLSGTTTTSSSKNVGNYATNIGGTSNNYNINFTQGNLSITKANAIVNANSNSVVYNGLTQNVNGFTVSGFVNNETKDVLTGLTGLITSGKNAGIYNTNIGGDDINYNLTFNQGKLTIAKANLDIIANSNSLVYNGQTQSVNGYSFGINGLLGSDTEADLNLSGTTTTSSSKNVGNYATNIGGTSDKYNINVAQGTLNIIKKDIFVTADNKSKKQGENNPNLTYVANGLIANDTLNGDLSTNATQNSEVGSYDIEKGSLDNPNYEIDFKKGKLIVEAKTEIEQPELPKPEIPNIQDVVDSISYQIAQTLQVESQIYNQRLNTNLNTQVLSFNNKFGVEIVNGGINAPTKEEEARNFQNMINK
ncbi:MBG domain-containing protein [Arcobacter porcinus]|uniref:MBG domain-containing protein n=1 Tax=Arcobacter porcinus TaxID=1935204 RepID=UPI00081EA311|nr:MBG domain-containing protein [Arcobacter porcinus]OCL82468.1 Heme/hemopexin-binding protein precursor [Arcobacter porcinus]